VTECTVKTQGQKHPEGLDLKGNVSHVPQD
jgi:hypothetical protein